MMYAQNNIYPQGTGYQYMGAQPSMQPTKIDNVLTKEQIESLMQKESRFTLQLSAEDRLRASCNHRSPDGLSDMITEDALGNCECQICHYVFRPVDVMITPESLQESVDQILDILQTVKLLYVGLQPDIATEYFQIIPLIEKIPKLFKLAVDDYTRHEKYNPYLYNNRNMSTIQLFNSLIGSPATTPIGTYGTYGQPQQPNPMTYPGAPAYGAPAMAPFNPYGMPASNGFGFQGAYNPNTVGYTYAPQQPQVTPVAEPVAQAAQPAVETTTTTVTA